jgi:serine/threonine protein kinase
MIGNSGGQLGNYRILNQLGHGGFADVYLGEHLYLHTPAAIKVLRTQLTAEDSEKFRQEALLIAHLAHPHIVRVLDFNVESATPFLVMEYASGGTLRQRFARGTPIPLADLLPYIRQVASALQYAHDRKLIHRDIKPENMLLSDEGEVKLSDFGIAVIVRNTQTQETTEHITGTMAYMAPEQLQGKARPASDQYSLAIAVYEWLTGKLPFRGSYMEIITQHLTTLPPPLDEQSLSLPHAVTLVLWKALSKNPTDRFARVQDFVNALEEAYQSGSSPAISQQATPKGEPVLEVTAIETPRRAVVPRVLPQQTSISTITDPPRSAPVKTLVAGKQSVVKKLTGCARTFAILFILIPLMLCGLGFAGYSYLSSRNSPAQAASLSNDFMTALDHQNYDQAYNDLGSSITNSTAHDAFIQQAQREDRCYGPITTYSEIDSSTPNGAQVYDYSVSRTKLRQPYHLHVTVTKDFWGNWSITDYNSDAGVGSSTCA